ncbi:hypothetical protein MBLNU459_g4033t1 [Dothideomycetes sp. NU459]
MASASFSREHVVAARDTGSSDHQSKMKAVIIVVSIVAVFLFGIIGFYIFRSIRYPSIAKLTGRSNNNNKRSWREAISAPFSDSWRHRQDPRQTIEVQDVSHDPEMGVDRHTSVRSVATLPAYSAVPREHEGVLGREGERAGMDQVVEFPEDEDEEEARREEEMGSLWRIRQQRRHEAAEREDRRRRRREARTRGDHATLTALRRESVLRATYRQENGSQAMIAEHNSRPRERRVSAVSYGDLGVATHNGTRVRANSNDSDSRPLLDGASASDMSGPGRPWVSRDSFSTHHRMPSATSVLSMSSVDYDDRERTAADREESIDVLSLQPTQTRSRAHSDARSMSRSLRRTSTPQVPPLDVDLGDSQIPLPEPPQYDSIGFEEAPPYESAVSSEPSASTEQQTHTEPVVAHPQLPAISRLPSIRIMESTPTESRYHEFPEVTPRPTTPSTIHEETT